MAIADVQEYLHLTDADVEAIGRELDGVRREIEESRGARDAAYIRRLISIQRRLAAAGRITLFASFLPPAWVAGTLMLGTAKILENMEIGHNVMHGQWDWMNDPEIHSRNWEWDTAQPAEQWKHSHNYIHHQFTNVLGYDNDIGYGILRVTDEQPWHWAFLGQPVFNALLALLFEWGVALHDLDVVRIRKGTKDMDELRRQLRQIGRKARRQVGKDYVLFPLLSGPFFLSTLTANACANLIRNLWTYFIIFCGHFPDGAQRFTEEELEGETRPQWYLRQMLGAANFEGGPLLHIMSGNLGFQIEHHLYPDLPSNRYAEISVRVRDLCSRYRIAYTTGPVVRQYGQVIRRILRLSLPDSFRKPTSNPLARLVQLPHRRRPQDRPGRRLETGGWFGRSVA